MKVHWRTPAHLEPIAQIEATTARSQTEAHLDLVDEIGAAEVRWRTPVLLDLVASIEAANDILVTDHSTKYMSSVGMSHATQKDIWLYAMMKSSEGPVN